MARLTDGGTGEAGSVFTNHQVGVSNFTTSFTFQQYDGTSPEADGFAFVIQGNSPTVLGPTGGGLGYGPDTPGGGGGLPNSIAVKFDLFSNQGEGTNSTGLYIDGASPTVPAVPIPTSDVDLHSGDVMDATLSYDGTTLTETIKDTVTGGDVHDPVHREHPVDPSGGLQAYAGFTGGTGGLTATQDIQTWKYDRSRTPRRSYAERTDGGVRPAQQQQHLRHHHRLEGQRRLQRDRLPRPAPPTGPITAPSPRSRRTSIPTPT